MANIKHQWKPSLGPQAVEVKTERTLAKSFYELKELEITHACYSGKEIDVTRDLIEKPNAVAIVLYDEGRDSVVMVEQFRVGALKQRSGPWLLELVAGIIEEGENAEEVAVRECKEETGLDITDLQHIYHFSPSPGGVAEYIDLFYAHVDSSLVTQFHGLKDEGEDIKVHVIDAQSAINMLATGEINNAFSMIGLQWLQLQRMQNKSKQ